MDLIDRQLEHEAQFPLDLTPIHDTEHLEGLNTLLTFDIPGTGDRFDEVLTGRVADPDKFFETLSKLPQMNAGHFRLIDVALTDKPPTNTESPAQFLVRNRTSQH